MKQAGSTEKPISLAEAAAILGINYQEAYGLAVSGAFECWQYRPGGRIRTTRPMVEAFRAKSKMGG